jgi:hypothetical protein
MSAILPKADNAPTALHALITPPHSQIFGFSTYPPPIPNFDRSGIEQSLHRPLELILSDALGFRVFSEPLRRITALCVTAEQDRNIESESLCLQAD